MEVTVNRKVPVGLKEGSSSALVLWLVNAVRLTEKHVGGLGAGFQTRAEKTMIAAGSCLILIGTPHINCQWDLNGIVHWFTGILYDQVQNRLSTVSNSRKPVTELSFFLFQCTWLRNVDTFDLSFTYLLTAETSSYYRTLRATMPTLLGLRLSTWGWIGIRDIESNFGNKSREISVKTDTNVHILVCFGFFHAIIFCFPHIGTPPIVPDKNHNTVTSALVPGSGELSVFSLPFTGDIGRQRLVKVTLKCIKYEVQGTTTDVRINVVFLEMMALVRRKDTQI
ncbi:hypothetical protein C8Q75DRAFT_734955 [Abortiporus biennis]|nr:hypothetical protein C8Q75DRAFT_734955 [Abortiporus biennis]